MHHFGIDVGGTFTDLVVADGSTGIHTLKVLSTPDDYSRGILDGVAQMVHAKVLRPCDIDRMVHAFTVATNALLTRTGARVGLITTLGFRDVLEIGRLRMPQLYNMDWDKPVPLVRRAQRLEVRERMSAAGEVVAPLVEGDVESAVNACAGGLGVGLARPAFGILGRERLRHRDLDFERHRRRSDADLRVKAGQVPDLAVKALLTDLPILLPAVTG